MYYLLLSVAAVLFASQFLFNQMFQREYGDALYSALIFNLYTSLISLFAMLAINGFRMHFSVFSVAIAFIYSFVSISYTYVSIKAFSMVNLSVYSVFAMLGGMLLPFIYGIVFGNERLTAVKVLCCILIAAALLLTVTKGKKGKPIYYISVFVLNGLSGVLSAIHQSGANAVESVDFMALNRLMSFALCTVIWALFFRKSLRINKKASIYSAAFALFCGFGNLLALIALKHLPASVQYPIITGGVMVISLFISIARKEEITYKNVISTILAFAASGLMMLS